MNARKRYRTCSKFTIKIPERRQWHWTYLTLFSSVFIVHFKQVIVCWTGSISLVPLHNPSTSWSWFFWIDIVEKRKKYGRNFCSKLDLSVKMLKKNYKKLICLLLLHFSHHQLPVDLFTFAKELLKVKINFWVMELTHLSKRWPIFVVLNNPVTWQTISRSNRPVLRPATLLKNRLWHRCFPMNFTKFLRTLFLQNSSGRLLLHKIKSQNFFCFALGVIEYNIRSNHNQ